MLGTEVFIMTILYYLLQDIYAVDGIYQSWFPFPPLTILFVVIPVLYQQTHPDVRPMAYANSMFGFM